MGPGDLPTAQLMGGFVTPGLVKPCGAPCSAAADAKPKRSNSSVETQLPCGTFPAQRGRAVILTERLGRPREGPGAAVGPSEESPLLLLPHGAASRQLAAAFRPCACLLKRLASTAGIGEDSRRDSCAVSASLRARNNIHSKGQRL